MAWLVVFLLVVFLVVWMSLTFTNQFCTGLIGFGLCYKTDKDPACPKCPPVAMAPSPAQTTTSTYIPEPYAME